MNLITSMGWLTSSLVLNLEWRRATHLGEVCLLSIIGQEECFSVGEWKPGRSQQVGEPGISLEQENAQQGADSASKFPCQQLRSAINSRALPRAGVILSLGFQFFFLSMLVEGLSPFFSLPFSDFYDLWLFEAKRWLPPIKTCAVFSHSYLISGI